jgi:AcrR family transcriptional regulator
VHYGTSRIIIIRFLSATKDSGITFLSSIAIMFQMEQPKTAKAGRPRSPKIHDAVLTAAAKLVLAEGFGNLTMDAIAVAAGVGRMTLYRRWPNKAAIVMDAFVARVDPNTLVASEGNYLETIRLQMRAMAKSFRGEDGILLRALLGAAQLDPELATALRDRWTLPRRRMAITYFRDGIKRGYLRKDVNPEMMIDLLYAPIYYRLQMGTGPLSSVYIDELYDHAMKGVRER